MCYPTTDNCNTKAINYGSITYFTKKTQTTENKIIYTILTIKMTLKFLVYFYVIEKRLQQYIQHDNFS